MQFKEVPDHSNYICYENGTVVNRKTGRVLKEDTTNRGYKRITVSKGNKVTRWSVHRLVALLFIPNPHNYETVNHISGDKTDNSVSNLEWMSQEQNQAHAKYTGLCPKGEAVGTNKFKEATIHQVCKLIERGLSRGEIMKATGVSKATFDDIRRRKTWKYVSCSYKW